MIFFFDFEIAGEDGGAIGEEEEMAGGHVEFAVFVGNGHEPNTKLKIMIWGEEKYEFWIKKHGNVSEIFVREFFQTGGQSGRHRG